MIDLSKLTVEAFKKLPTTMSDSSRRKEQIVELCHAIQTQTTIANTLGLSQVRTNNLLRKLVEQRQIVRKRVGRAFVYVSTEVLQSK